MYQEKYWRELDQLKVHIYYLESYLEKTINTDRLLKMFLAISLCIKFITDYADYTDFLQRIPRIKRIFLLSFPSVRK